MNNYTFCDVSHHNGDLTHQVFASAGHRIAIAKASDNYHMPDRQGKYDFPAERHFDSRWVDNFSNFRRVGLLCAGYHFVRFDRPIASRSTIIQKNLDYFLHSISLLPNESLKKEASSVVMLDMEQPSSQLEAAGLNINSVSDMAVKIVKKFVDQFQLVIFYSGSWWTNIWLTKEASLEIASMTTAIEAEYPSGMLSSDKQSVSWWRRDYIPSVTYGYAPEFATSSQDVIGKLFAHQFTSKSEFPPLSGFFDLNRTELDKSDLYDLFNQEGSVDPPPPDYEENFEEIDSKLDMVKGEIDRVRINLASHHLDVEEEFSKLNTRIDAIELSMYGTKEVRVVRDGDPDNIVFVMEIIGYNDKDKPVFLWPEEVPKRVQIEGNSVIRIYKNTRTIGNGGVACWLLDLTQELPLTWGSAPIDLAKRYYIWEKNIIEGL